MNDLKIFQNQDFGEVRVVVKGDEPWFVAADVCRALDLEDTSKAVSRLDEDEKGTNTVPTLGGKQDMSIISEPGLYALVLTSRKPEARAFKRWITHDILPSIRMTGSYTADQRLPIIFQAPDIGSGNQQRVVRLDADAYRFVRAVSAKCGLPASSVVSTIIRKSAPHVRVVADTCYRLDVDGG